MEMIKIKKLEKALSIDADREKVGHAASE